MEGKLPFRNRLLLQEFVKLGNVFGGKGEHVEDGLESLHRDGESLAHPERSTHALDFFLELAVVARVVPVLFSRVANLEG